MKSFCFLLAILFSSVMFVACEGDVGPEGPKGATGDAGAAGAAGAKGDKGTKGNTGAAGANGNTEVFVFEGGAGTMAEGQGKFVSFTYAEDRIPRAKAETSAVFLYLRVGQEWWSVPGSIYVGSGRSQYFSLEVDFPTNITRLSIFRWEGVGALNFSAAKAIFVPKTSTARQAAVDYRDYEAVKKYYNLAD